MQKFDELILREISRLLAELFSGEIVSVTQVHVSKDLSFAKVWLSSVGDIDALVKIANSNSKVLRHDLSKSVVARRVPNLYFVADKTEEKASKIDKLLKEINK